MSDTTQATTRREFFNVLRVSRDDFAAKGFDASQVDDDTMAYFASKIGDSEALMDAFWEAVKWQGECRGLPKLDGFRDCDLCGVETKCIEIANPIRFTTDNDGREIDSGIATVWACQDCIAVYNEENDEEAG